MDDQTVLAWGQPQASLVVRQGAQVGTTFPIIGDQAILGREEGVGVSIRDPEVSRRHARISWQSGNYYIEDLGSTNGTFLNGALVTSPQPLQGGDTLGVGQTTLVFQTQAGARQAEPATPSIQPAPPPPPTAPPVEQKRGGSRCLLWGCGCLVLLGLLIVVAVGVAALVMPAQIEEILNTIFSNIGLEVDVMLYGTHLLV